MLGFYELSSCIIIIGLGNSGYFCIHIFLNHFCRLSHGHSEIHNLGVLIQKPTFDDGITKGLAVAFCDMFWSRKSGHSKSVV